MSYLGNQPAANFASVIKDTFSGNGSTTAFTLSKAATTNGVAVFVENVRQEPTTAYAVSGTTLTFTAAPVSASGNNIYVLHHNAVASTATHPAAQALTATSGTFSAGVSGTTGTFTGAFTSVGIDDNADATTMTIDTSENIGIGNTSPSSQYMTRLVVGDGSGTEGITIYSGNDSSGRLEFSDATSGDGRYAGGIVYEHNNNKLRFNTNGGNERLGIDSSGNVTINAGNLVMSNGQGIDFSATGDGTTMSSELFSDYEEGLWNATLAPQSSGSVTVATGTDACQYTRIGKMVFLSGAISISSVSSPSGVLRMSGFPYAVADLTDYGGRSLATINIQAGAIPPNNYGMWLTEGDSHGSIYNFTDAEQPQSTASNNFSGNETIYFSIMYRTS